MNKTIKALEYRITCIEKGIVKSDFLWELKSLKLSLIVLECIDNE